MHTFRKLLSMSSAVGLTLMLTACGSSWETIYNNNNLQGWTIFTDPTSSATPSDVFKAKNDVIEVSGKPFGYIRTNKQYADYRLTVEWRWTDGKGCNSGIFQRLQPGDKLWPTGVECQLQAGHAGDFIGLGGASIEGSDANAKFPKKPRSIRQDPEKPAGQWNKAEIICRGTHVTVMINGIKVNETNTTLRQGYIALQSEGGQLQFRNIRIRPLK